MSYRPAINPQLPMSPDTKYNRDLVAALQAILRTISTRLNGLSDGQLSSVDNAATVAPTTGTYAKGDFIRNSAPAELGAAASKYLITGWTCSVGGTPGTWLQNRTLTGN